MDRRWDRLEAIRQQPPQPQQQQQQQQQEENDAWESNSSDEDSSVEDYDGADIMMQQPEVDIDDELAYEFPRDDLSVLLDGLNKWPWNVYPLQLTNCLISAGKIASLGMEEASSELRRLQTLYREAVPSAFEKCLDDKAIWKWNDDVHNNIFDALCRLIDLAVAKLPQLQHEDASAVEDLLPLLRSISLGFDKQSQYHVKHKEQNRPTGSLSQLSKFARPVPGIPSAKKSGDWYCTTRKVTVKEAEGCECSKCRPPDVYCWLSYLLNYFGQTPYGNGYQQLLRVLSHPHKLMPAILEAALSPISKATEFLTDEVAEAFAEPCSRVLKYVSDKLETDVDALSDKMKDGSFAALSSILKHLQIIIARSSSIEMAESTVSVVQRRMVERMLGFQSFNKHLSAVREINKLLENARAIASKDNSLAVRTTIQWLEKNDILRQILRSHLHHKQYVDQVQKIMKFLLQEKRLSNEHLEAIWAATEKPDQFEAVKANIFDLIADLAWSFSPDQLDSLFGRFERCQGQSTSDIVKILTLVKKLARSDSKGSMASRLLEFLWKMMLSGEARGDVLESGAFTEILGHYDSINCASKDVYISRCLANLKEGKCVIPSLRLLRDFIWSDNERPFYQDEITRQMRMQQLIKDHDLLNMVVTSLEEYMTVARSSFAGNGTISNVCEFTSSSYTHDEQVKERLDFLLFVLQSGSGCLSLEATERLWNCMIEAPISGTDRERAFYWFCEVLDKSTTLSLEAQASILTKKLSFLNPASLSQAAWRCFLRLFLWVNQSEKKLKRTRTEDITVTHDLDLVGLPYLWQIALWSPFELIVDQSINALKDIHTSLSDNLQEDVAAIRQKFIDECMKYLNKALDAGGVKSSEASESSNIASCSMGEGNSESLDKMDEKELVCSRVGEGNKTFENRCIDADITSSTSLHVGEAHQVERCLRILRIFILKCEGRCSRFVPPHTATFQGRPLTLGVSTANKQSTRFDVTVHTNEYLSSLRAKVAKQLENPVSRVRLTYLNQELIQDSQVLWQCGLIGGQTISASVNMIERILKPMDEQHLPGILISKNLKFYDMLFKLANASDSNVRESSNSLLLLLPTHPAILADFQNLCKKDSDEAHLLLASHFGARSRLLYTLQVLDGLVMPVNRAVDVETLEFRKAFLQSGGFQHLLAVLEPGALPEGVDNQTRRGCYASSLRLLKFLLSEKIAYESSSMAVTEVTCAMRVTETEGGLNEISGESEVPVQNSRKAGQMNGRKEDLESVDMPSVIGVFRRMTWAAAVGQLSAMGISSPVASVLRKPGGRSAKKRSFPDEDESGLDPEDQYLCVEALDFMTLCLLKHKYLWSSFFTSPDTETFIVAMILHSPDTAVRYRAAVNFMKLGAIRNGFDRMAHKQILMALTSAKVEASQHPKRCIHFWELLGHFFYTIEGEEEREMAEQQLEDELQWLKTAPPAVDDDDRLLEGHLLLVRVLVEVLDKRIIGASKVPQGRGLVQLLIKHFLFPDSAILLHDKENMTSRKGQIYEVSFGVLGVSSEDDGLLQSKCGTRGSRERAFQLLICLATHCKESFREIVDLIIKIHLSDQVIDWEHLPSYGRKAVGGFVGLKNAGATCYMNSVFQQLFMQPEVRRSVLSCSECEDVEKAGSVFFQLQAMFGALLGSSLDHYTPQGFWCAYRDYDGMPINLREHQDAFEFFNRLYDAIDETLKATHQETTLTRIFGGVFAQQVICRGCPHRSEREEPFAAISVDVKNKKDLLESLEAFVRGDLLEVDNAYYCDECGIKVDALKRVCVKSLPHTLVIHLKRFDFDYETMQRLKLKDRFEFPTHIDMKPYTVEGLALRETQTQSTCSPSELSNDLSDVSSKQDEAGRIRTNLLKPDSYYEYDLVGVVVHSGTAFAGHYYSYIKQRSGDHPLNCGSGRAGRWIAFDDKHVESYDANDLEKDCFGGKYSVDVYDNFLKTTTPQEFDRPNSAYMLLYERSQHEALSAYSPARTAMSLTKDDDDGDELMKENPMPEHLANLSLQMPASVHRSVWEENLRFVHENHLMDKDYFRFLLRLVEVNYDLIDARASWKYRTSILCGTDQQLEGLQSAWGDVNPRNDEVEGVTDVIVDEFAKLMITLSTEFLLKVYLRTHMTLREDLPLWKSLMWKLFDHNMLACRSFIRALVEQTHWIQEYLIKCPVDELQQFFASTLVQALRCAVCFLRGNSLYLDANGCSSDALQIDALVDVLISILRDPTLPKYSCHQYFQVIFEYANIGPRQRFHLLQKSIISQLVTTTLNFATKVTLQVAKLDFSCLHSVVSLLLRNCDTSKLQNIPDIDSGNISSEGEDYVDTVREVPASNPRQLPPPLFPVAREAIDAVFKQRVYSTVLVETCPENEEVIKLLEFCCWQNEAFSMWVLQDVLDAFHRAGNSEVKSLLTLMFRILLLEDSLQTLRQEILLLGYENFRSGVMAFIVMRTITSQKRYSLLKFVVKLVSACPAIRVHLLGRRADWKRVVDWLQEELQPHGSPSSINAAAVSNEDLSNGHLQRTSTAEWTLTNARSLFSS